MKLLFLVSDFDQGGITSSLINLTNVLVEKGHVVHLLNLPGSSELPLNFNANITFIYLDKKASMFNIHMKDFKRVKGLKKVKYLFFGFIKKLLRNKWYDICFSKTVFDNDYDASIAYRQGPVDYYIAKYIIHSKMTIGFYHGDGISQGDTSNWDSCLSYMNKVVAVSNSARDHLRAKYPYIKDKFSVVYNIVNPKLIKNLALEKKIESYCFEIVTVARIDLSDAKRQDRIIDISRKLIDDNLIFHWTIVGGGEDLEKLQRMIKDNNLSNHISCTGSLSNPFPYIKSADLFVLTSTNESFGMVVLESLILNTPVVAGYYQALSEVLDSKYGILADNSIEGIYQAIKRMIVDKNFYNEIKNNCNMYKYDSDIAYRQFLELFND